jgi:uncharacterized protein (TIGR03032 family)
MTNSNVTWQSTRYFGTWMNDTGLSILVTAYKTHHIYSIGLTDKGEISIWFANMLRPMGIACSGKSLWVSNLGNLIHYEDKGSMKDKEHGIFDKNFVPMTASYSGDVDVHDVCLTSTGEVFYCSALFSCICKPSYTKSFELYWKPPWIDRLAAEDRCHLNGLCLVNDEPRYVTSACMANDMSAWRDIKGKGIVYDIKNEKIVCSGLYNPHSPRWHNDKLWILESGTGYFGYVDLNESKFVKCVFVPTFLRGMHFHENFCVVSGSLDRHDSAFNELPLGKTLQEKDIPSKCGIWVIDLDTFDLRHSIIFNDPVTELYDLIVVKSRRPKVFELADVSLLNKFFI